MAVVGSLLVFDLALVAGLVLLPLTQWMHRLSDIGIEDCWWSMLMSIWSEEYRSDGMM